MGVLRAGSGRLVVCVLVLSSALGEAPRAQTPSRVSAAPRPASELERETDRAVQDYRAGKGLPPLARTFALDELARQHSRDMAARAFAAHRSPEGTGTGERASAAGIAFLKIAENIARTRGVEDPVRVAVDGWIHSPSHRASLLDPGYTETGIGVAVTSDGTVYFTQLFLRPMP